MLKNFKYLLTIIVCTFLNSNLNASECFILKDLNKNEIIKKYDDDKICETRFSPCSTFKIPLSLIGFDSQVLKNEKKPELRYKNHYHEVANESQKSPQNPEKWIKTSPVWYSQEAITKKIGTNKLNDYVKKFNYGNMDLSGDQGKNNGLTHSWLGSSLKISPLEQIEFLEKILGRKFKISIHAYNMTEKITYLQNIDDWELHGKTGSCFQINEDGSKNPNKFAGWFIGWLEKGNKKIIFVKFMKDEKDVKTDDYIGPRIKKSVIEELSKIKFK
jgi:beta-lactamase class D